MRTLKTWIICAVIAVGCLVIGALEDGPVQEQIAADELKAAQIQARVEAQQRKTALKAPINNAAHLLALDHIR